MSASNNIPAQQTLERDIRLAEKAQTVATQSIANFLEACNPVQAGDTQKLLTKLIAVAKEKLQKLPSVEGLGWLDNKSPACGDWNLISRRGLPANNPLNDANTVEVEIFDSTRSDPAYWVCSAVFWHSRKMWHIVGGGATTAATHWRYKTYPEGETTLPIGTPIRFTKDLTAAAGGDHPGLLFARSGEEGLITGHGTPEGYWAKSNQHPNSFGASPAEFEVIA